MIDKVEFTVHTETPTAAHYEHDWTPAPEVVLGGIWGPAVVSAPDGQWYFGLRGWSDMIYGLTHAVSPVCGFQALQRTVDGEPTHLYPEYAGLDWMEPYEVHEADGTSTLSFDSGRVERSNGATHWYDASGRWEVHARTISDIFVVHVPVQEGVDQEVYYRHELLKATGLVDGKEVEGYLHQDFAYGPIGTTYIDLAIARHLYGLWFSWIHEDEDGGLGGGCFWQGRDGIDFGPGYLLHNGATTAYSDVTTTSELTDNGKLSSLTTQIGGETFRFDLTMSGSPIHSFGEVGASSLEVPVRTSWCWAEYPAGMVNAEILWDPLESTCRHASLSIL